MCTSFKRLIDLIDRFIKIMQLHRCQILFRSFCWSTLIRPRDRTLALYSSFILSYECVYFQCQTQGDGVVLANVAQIMEQSVPLMDHPGEGFLAQLEEDIVKLVLRHGMSVSYTRTLFPPIKEGKSQSNERFLLP